MSLRMIHRSGFVTIIALWWLAFVALSITHFNHFQILNIFGFFTLSLLPGMLTIIAMRLRERPLWAYIGIAVTFSIFELLIVALFGDALLPFLHVARPLDAPVLLAEFSVLIIVLLALASARVGRQPLSLPARFFESMRDRVLAFFPSIFVLMAIAGSIELNNGGTGTLTLVMLLMMAIYLALLVVFAEDVGPNVIPTALYFMALALLLMNSLRGWYITGHDIQKEYHVFELAKLDGIWSIANYRDAYNACMSITILPTIYSNLLSLADPYVYKAIFQILFASVAPVIYLSMRRYVAASIAFLGAFYFLAFPTFYNDMSFLNRQEIAFIFLAVMMYVIFDKSISVGLRRTLFLLLGIGMVLSHYSTTYTVIAILAMLSIAQLFIVWLVPIIRDIFWLENSPIPALQVNHFRYRPLITVWMLVILAGASFIWTSILTNTDSGSIDLVVASTIDAMKSTTKEDAKSTDVSASLLSWQKNDPQTILDTYEKDVIAPAVAAAPANDYYASTTYAQYPIKVAPEETVPLTAIGSFLADRGVDISNDNYLFRQGSAKLLQVLIILGFVVTLFARRYFETSLDTEFFLLACANLVMLVAIVVLPVLSVQYGVFRAFQQSLMFLGPFIIIGFLALFARWRGIGMTIATLFAILFFLSETGALTQVFGGYNPQLDLNNDGLYYDIYYSHESEIAGIDWLSGNINLQQQVQTPTQSDFYTVQKVTSLTDLNPINDIYPGLIRKNSYVFLGYTTATKQRATITYNGTQVTYTYPIQFLDDNKDLVYDNAQVKIYR